MARGEIKRIYPKGGDNDRIEVLAFLNPDCLVGKPISFKEGLRWNHDYMITSVCKKEYTHWIHDSDYCDCTQIRVAHIPEILLYGYGFNVLTLSKCNFAKSPEKIRKIYLHDNKLINFEIENIPQAHYKDQKWKILGLTLLDSQKWFPPEEIVRELRSARL